MAIGAAAIGRPDVVKVARPWLERLVAATDETVHMSVLDVSGGIVYISKVESPRSIRVQTQIGQLSPAWCTATDAASSPSTPLPPSGSSPRRCWRAHPKTVTDPRRIRAVLKQISVAGYAVTRAENHPEMGGIAAPIRDHAGTVIAAVGVGVPDFRMTRELEEKCVPHVVEAAAGISFELGFRPDESRSSAVRA
ncbi:MAG: hypothetical protein IPK29_16065 [Betaproteobacteria bacterium]|nr:hypothetical protein [Betaproteobacteria bacterium]